MSTQDHLIHIELAATVTVDDDTPLPCSITLNLGEQNTPSQANTTSQEKSEEHHEPDCDNKLNSDTPQATKKNDFTDPRPGVIAELFGLPDDVPEETQNEDTHKADLGLKIGSTPSPTKSSKDNLGGGGDKPISSRQRNLINKMADEQNKNVEEVVNSICHKSIDDLKGHEADKVIKSMRKPRR